MHPPLPVDVVSTWWDYFVDGVGVVSGLATAGALLVAALAYQRQVNESRRKQASNVTLSFIPQEDESVDLVVKNNSDQDIVLVSAEIPKEHPAGPPYRTGHRLLEMESIDWESFPLRPDWDLRLASYKRSMFAKVIFLDSTGKGWERDTFGVLVPVSRGRISKLRFKFRIAKRWG